MSDDVTIVSHKDSLDAVLTSASRRILLQKAEEGLRVAKAGAGVALKDFLRYSVQGTTFRDLSVRIGSDKEEVLYGEQGTKPHIITPRNGKYLKFPGTGSSRGKTVFTVIVHHPGTKGAHFLRSTLRRIIR